MSQADRWTRVLLANDTVWPWQWRRLLVEVEPLVVDLLLDQLATSDDYRARNGYLGSLCRLATAPRLAPLCPDAECASLLVAALARETVAEAQEHSDSEGSLRPNLELYGELLTACGAAAGPALRTVLAGPPREVGPVLWGQGMVTVGVKLTALAALDAAFTLADTPLLAALVRDADEPLEVRDAAALPWHRLAGAVTGPAIADLAVQGPVGDDAGTWLSSGGRAERLAALGACLVEPLAAHLQADSVEVRLRAKHMLQAVGEPAIARLTEIIRTAPSWQVRTDAEEALRVISRRALAKALALREADDRSLSRAEAPARGAERGLSRADEAE